MDQNVISLLSQWPMVAVMFILYMAERSENKKIVEQARADSIRHEETILKITANMGRCPVVAQVTKPDDL